MSKNIDDNILEDAFEGDQEIKCSTTHRIIIHKEVDIQISTLSVVGFTVSLVAILFNFVAVFFGFFGKTLWYAIAHFIALNVGLSGFIISLIGLVKAVKAKIEKVPALIGVVAGIVAFIWGILLVVGVLFVAYYETISSFSYVDISN